MASVRDDRFVSRLAFLALAALLAWLLWLILRPFVSPILWALLLAFLLFPVNRALRARAGGRKGIVALLMTIAVMLGIVAPAAFLTLVFAKQAADLLGRVSEAATRYHVQTPQDIFRIPLLNRVVTWVIENTPISADQLQQWMIDGARNALEFVLASGRVVLLGALGAVLSLFLMLFILYFFFRDGEDMARRLVRLVPAPESRKHQLMTYLGDVTRAVVYGSLLTALIQGGLVGIAFAIVGLPSAVVFGVLAAILSLLPVGGTAFIWGPGAIVLWGEGHWGKALFLAAWGALLVGTIDNLLRPLFISGRARISTLPIFFGVIGGLGAFGPIGMFLGPVLIALALALMRFVEDARSGKAAPAD